jgi:hypothetical protein
MKLTIELDEELVQKARHIAEQRGCSLDAVIGEALKRAAAAAPRSKPRPEGPRRALPTFRPTPGNEGLVAGIKGTIDKPRELLEEVEGPGYRP